MFKSKIVTFDDLKQYRLHEKEIVVLCHGAFDVFHPGHLYLLEQAREFGSSLVVSLTSDEYIRQTKGESRPYFPERQRLEMVAALCMVNWVVLNPHPDATELIQLLRPHVFVKGEDTLKERPTPGMKNEAKAMEKVGGRVEFTRSLAYHSTEMRDVIPVHA